MRTSSTVSRVRKPFRPARRIESLTSLRLLLMAVHDIFKSSAYRWDPLATVIVCFDDVEVREERVSFRATTAWSA